ncbi:MAG: class I SAM-dependent methyltransferase [Chloroflexi bacterium]|nr:class I SAM-dependent methyltransferase [Chloroflexota bacterium]
MLELVSTLMDRSPGLRRSLNKALYQYLARLDRQGEILLMNYGYVAAAPIVLKPEDEPNRVWLQLYDQVAGAVDLSGLDVLEVGSGRGGGASYVMRYRKPKTMTGIDFAQNSVAFCRRRHQVDGLSFVHGDAENMPFEDGQFGAVINVESSHGYGSMERFMNEVHRVLVDGGHFLWTDFRMTDRVAATLDGFKQAGFSIEQEEIITQQVLGGLDHQTARNRALIDREVPKIARPLFYRFAAVDGTTLRHRFESGE